MANMLHAHMLSSCNISMLVKNTKCILMFINVFLWHNLAESKAYIASSDTKTWSDAQLYCETEYNTNLAVIESSIDDTFVRDAATAGGVSTSDWVWIGLYDSNNDDVWEWIDGTTVSYTNFLSGQPDEDGECIHKWPAGSDQWNDVSCTATVPFACDCDLYIGVALSLSWSDAESYCQSTYGTHLASFSNTKELECAYQTAYLLSTSLNFWVGLYESSTDNNWVFSDSSSFDGNNWNSGQPNSSGSLECGEIEDDGNGHYLNDVGCSTTQYFLCNSGSNLLCQNDKWEVTYSQYGSSFDYDDCSLALSGQSRMWFGNSDGTIPDSSYDYSWFEFQVTLNVTDVNAGMIFRANSISNVIDDSGNFYLYALAENELSLLRMLDGSWTYLIQTNSVTINLNTEYTLKIISYGNTYDFLIDGVNVWTSIELNDHTDGTIGLRAYLSGTATFRNLYFTDTTPTNQPTYHPTSEPTSYTNAYVAVSSLMTWYDAQWYCISTYGTSLATILNSDDNSIVASVATDDYIWIGINDINDEGIYEWSDGSGLASYTNWNDAEPNNVGNEDCTELIVSSGKWNDLSCDEATRYFACDLPYLKIGPYLDTTNRNMRAGIGSGYTAFECYQACTGIYTYFAMQAGVECWCDSNFTHATRNGPGTCDETGGSYCNYIYIIDEPTTEAIEYTYAPTFAPTNDPSNSPTRAPVMEPTDYPSQYPTFSPSISPTSAPSFSPVANPTTAPSNFPNTFPTSGPSVSPTLAPSGSPSLPPTRTPSSSPSRIPSSAPSGSPSIAPTRHPSVSPTFSPVTNPTIAPSIFPSTVPTNVPTAIPTKDPTNGPSLTPTAEPTNEPTYAPVINDNLLCNENIWRVTYVATSYNFNVSDCSLVLTGTGRMWFGNSDGTIPESNFDYSSFIFGVTLSVDLGPNAGMIFKANSISNIADDSGDFYLFMVSQAEDEIQLLRMLDDAWTYLERYSVTIDLNIKYSLKIISFGNSSYNFYLDDSLIWQNYHLSDFKHGTIGLRTYISGQATFEDLFFTEYTTNEPTYMPSSIPSIPPTSAPSLSPVANPTIAPSNFPSTFPTSSPFLSPTMAPSGSPSLPPTRTPSSSPSRIPSDAPSGSPSIAPTSHPSVSPTFSPVTNPTIAPSIFPSTFPTNVPNNEPTTVPSTVPSNNPTSNPTSSPTLEPTDFPSNVPTNVASEVPSTLPSINPSYEPSNNPSNSPTIEPSSNPSKIPTSIPTSTPTNDPTVVPTSYNYPSNVPTGLASNNMSYISSSVSIGEEDDASNSSISMISNTSVAIAAIVGCAFVIVVIVCSLLIYCERKNQRESNLQAAKEANLIALASIKSRSVDIAPTMQYNKNHNNNIMHNNNMNMNNNAVGPAYNQGIMSRSLSINVRSVNENTMAVAMGPISNVNINNNNDIESEIEIEEKEGVNTLGESAGDTAGYNETGKTRNELGLNNDDDDDMDDTHEDMYDYEPQIVTKGNENTRHFED